MHARLASDPSVTDERFSQAHLLHRRQHFVDPLARRSFALHAELDAAIDIDLGIDSETLGVAGCPRRDEPPDLVAPGWLGECRRSRQFGTPETTAQVTLICSHKP